MNSNVLQKLLKPKSQDEKLEEFLKPQRLSSKKAKKAPGRPKFAKEKKARNFTLCLAPQYLEFLDKMTVKDPKIQGRGRKIRFIIDRFIEHEKRTLYQLKVLKEALMDVQKVLSGFGSRVKKGQKLELTSKEKSDISKVVERVHVLMKLLGYSPKNLQKLLAAGEWSVVSFCLDWKVNRGVSL
jgi:hypothetical protein